MRDLKMVFLTFCLAVLILFTLGGCAPVIEVQSNLAADYRVDLDKVFVVLDSRQLDDTTMRINLPDGDFSLGATDTTSFTTHFLDELALSFEAVNVEIQVHRVTGLELSENEVTGGSEEFQADAVLWVKEAWFGVLRDKGLLGLEKIDTVTAIDLDAYILRDSQDKEAVWRAAIEVEAGRSGLPQMAQELAKTLVGKLVADGLIDPANTK